DKKDIFLSGPLVTDINIRRNITTRKVTDMDRAICIGKGGGNENSVVFFHSLKWPYRMGTAQHAKIPIQFHCPVFYPYADQEDKSLMLHDAGILFPWQFRFIR